jgi:hypothetical protein
MTAACKKKHANQELGSPIDSEGENGEPEVLLRGDLAGILSLAAGRKTPVRPQDERVLLSLVAGVHSHRWRQGLFQTAA